MPSKLKLVAWLTLEAAERELDLVDRADAGRPLVCHCAGKPFRVKAAAGGCLPMQRFDSPKPARSVSNSGSAILT